MVPVIPIWKLVGAGATPLTSGGVLNGGRRGFVACSHANAYFSSFASSHAPPSSSSAIGSPSLLNPAGIAIAGNPVVALSWQLVPPCASPISAGLRRSVG